MENLVTVAKIAQGNNHFCFKSIIIRELVFPMLWPTENTLNFWTFADQVKITLQCSLPMYLSYQITLNTLGRFTFISLYADCRSDLFYRVLGSLVMYFQNFHSLEI